MNATISDNQGIGTIIDTEVSPALSISDATVTEGNTAIFTVSLNNASQTAITVDLATADGTAIAGGTAGIGTDDYTAVTTTLTFAAGQTFQLVTVTTINDPVYEGTETFTVNLSGAVNATISDNQGIGTIIDTEVAPALSISDATVTEGNTAIFTVSLNNASQTAITVDLAHSRWYGDSRWHSGYWYR